MQHIQPAVRFGAPSGSSPLPEKPRGTRAATWDFSKVPIFPSDLRSISRTSTPTPLIQLKLAIGEVNDPLEHEADRVADQVMRMTEPRIQRQCACGGTCARCTKKDEIEPGPGPIQMKHIGLPGPALTEAPPIVHNVLRSPGQLLDKATREFMEPRLGHNLSRVRVHTDALAGAAARDIGARAYTLGSDIAFAPGEFQPKTEDGRALIAHELAHVVQHGRGPLVVRRKIKCDPRAKLDGFLSTRGVQGFTESNSVYDRPNGGAASSDQELLIDMLASPRIFHLDGDSDASAGANLAAHVKARTGIIAFASKKQYNFAALSGWSMNPAFYEWDLSKGIWKVKPGVDPKAAWEEVNLNPKLYAIGCAAATSITMHGGSGGADIIDMPSGDQADWVAGDSGYVENTKYDPRSGKIGLMGENIIYTGGGMFWGHFTGSITYRTLADWVSMVNSWNGGANVDTKRELPATGLLDK